MHADKSGHAHTHSNGNRLEMMRSPERPETSRQQLCPKTRRRNTHRHEHTHTHTHSQPKVPCSSSSFLHCFFRSSSVSPSVSSCAVFCHGCHFHPTSQTQRSNTGHTSSLAVQNLVFVQQLDSHSVTSFGERSN